MRPVVLFRLVRALLDGVVVRIIRAVGHRPSVSSQPISDGAGWLGAACVGEESLCQFSRY